MHKERLFELIRKEEVMLWAGAGMSKYAGYPLGGELCRILHESLSNNEKKAIPPNLGLQDLVERIYDLRGDNKNHIINILINEFHKEPISLETHSLIASIPHIKTIVTTNYDRLFEKAYDNKAQMFFKDDNIPYLDNKKAHIFKLHGDLSDPNSVILKESDYNRFFKDNTEYSQFWSVVKGRISTSHIVFVGYSISDPNIKVILEKINDSFGDNRKEWFFVAPSLNQIEKETLIRKGINYIDSNGEDFFNELKANIKKNIIHDLDDNIVSVDSFMRVFENESIEPEIKLDDGEYKLKSLQPKGDNIEGLLKIEIDKAKTKLEKELKDFYTGRKFGTVKLSYDEIENADLTLGGFNLLRNKEYLSIELSRQPNFKTVVDFVFSDFEITKLPVEVYYSKHRIEIHIKLENADIEIESEHNSKVEFMAQVHYKHHDKGSSIQKEIELFELLKRLSIGDQFKLYSESKPIFSNHMNYSEEMNQLAEYYFELFKMMKEIEKHYNVRFQNYDFDEIGKSERIIWFIYNIATKGFVINPWGGDLQIELKDQSDEYLNLIKDASELASHPIIAKSDKIDIFQLCGVEFQLGYPRIEYRTPYIENIDEITQKNTRIAIIKSKSDVKHISYTHEIDTSTE